MGSLSTRVKTLRIKPDGSTFAVAAGTTDVNSDIVDTAGFEGVRFILGLGAITANGVQSIKIQQNDVNSGTGMEDLAGSSVSAADDEDNQIVVIEVLNPRERYLRAAILRETANAVIDFLIVELFNPRKLPATVTDDTVVATERHVSPAEGTA